MHNPDVFVCVIKFTSSLVNSRAGFLSSMSESGELEASSVSGKGGVDF